MDPRRHAADIRRVATMACRRKITRAADLTQGEALMLQAALAAFADKARLPEDLGGAPGEAEPVVLLADQTAQWEQKWYRDDPGSYRAETGREEPL